YRTCYLAARRLLCGGVVAVQVAPPSVETSYDTLVPLRSALPATLRYALPILVTGGVFAVPVSVRLAKVSVPALGAVLSTITAIAAVVEMLPAGSVTTAWY